MKMKKIILGVSASIAIYKACEIVRQLMRDNLSVSVVMTEHAKRLISPQVFSSLSGGRVYPHTNYNTRENRAIGGGVYWDIFADIGSWEIKHISLAKEADLVLIAPATANIIGKIASGIADDLLTTMVMAVRAPVLIAPAMNENMFKNKIVQGNIQKLKNLGYKFIEPKRGRLACGDIGVGHLAEVETIVKEVKRSLK